MFRVGVDHRNRVVPVAENCIWIDCLHVLGIILRTTFGIIIGACLHVSFANTIQPVDFSDRYQVSATI